MVNDELRKTPWVICKVGKEKYSVSTTYVREMVQVPNVTEVPRMPSHVRGVINLRGNIIPLIDLRQLLGLKSAEQENEALIKTLEARKQDHLNWVDNLEKSVKEGVEFTGQLDPHKCAFGMWYDTFTTENLMLSGLLKRFSQPHETVHAVGVRVKALIAKGHVEKARAMIEKTRNKELHELIDLFDSVIDHLRNDNTEIAVVLTHDHKNIAATVDAVESVEYLRYDSFGEPPLGEINDASHLLVGTARKMKSEELFMLLDGMKLINETIEAGTLAAGVA